MQLDHFHETRPDQPRGRLAAAKASAQAWAHIRRSARLAYVRLGQPRIDHEGDTIIPGEWKVSSAEVHPQPGWAPRAVSGT